MLAAALELEVDDHLNALRGELDEHGRRLVVRNGHARPRTITTAAGAVPIRAARVNDKRVDADSGERQRFRSSIIARGAARARRCPKCCRCCICTGCPPVTSPRL
jgi:putative transposase